MNTVTGAMSALITPFRNGRLDTETYEKLIQRQIRHGMDALVPVGTQANQHTLSHSEHKECIEIAVRSAKAQASKFSRVQEATSTLEAIDLAKFAEKMGADGILCVTPYYNKPIQEGLFQHYKAVVGPLESPHVYNVPGAQGLI
jgi:4-hydroxy-tetrahydrodipicolinate synthase